MSQQPPVEAIFFGNDDFVQGALLAALRMKIKVPKQVAIAGFNDLTGSDQMLPPLSTMLTPREDVGTAAAGMLIRLMKGETVATPCVDGGMSWWCGGALDRLMSWLVLGLKMAKDACGVLQL